MSDICEDGRQYIEHAGMSQSSSALPSERATCPPGTEEGICHSLPARCSRIRRVRNSDDAIPEGHRAGAYGEPSARERADSEHTANPRARPANRCVISYSKQLRIAKQKPKKAQRPVRAAKRPRMMKYWNRISQCWQTLSRRISPSKTSCAADVKRWHLVICVRDPLCQRLGRTRLSLGQTQSQGGASRCSRVPSKVVISGLTRVSIFSCTWRVRSHRTEPSLKKCDCLIPFLGCRELITYTVRFLTTSNANGHV